MMKSFMSHENYTTASANYAEAHSACTTMSCASDNTVMLIMGAIIMASIIIFSLIIGVSVGVVGAVVGVISLVSVMMKKVNNAARELA